MGVVAPTSLTLLKPLWLVFHLVLGYVSTFAALASQETTGAFPTRRERVLWQFADCKIYHRDLLEHVSPLAFPIPAEFMLEFGRRGTVDSYIWGRRQHISRRLKKDPVDPTNSSRCK